MDNKETYGIELQMLVEKFNNKIKKVKNDLQSFGKQAKANVSVNIDNKDIDSEINRVRAKIKDLKSDILEHEKLGITDDPFWTVNPFYESYQEELKQSETYLNQLLNKQKELNDEVDKTSKKKMSFSFEKNIDKLTKKMKRFVLSLFSIRSAYALVSRASSAYLSVDTELANKQQAAWIGLGSVLAPAIETLSNGLLKLVSYVNVFMEALTGTNYIANATAKYMKNVTKSTNEASKSLAVFDQIVNLTDNSSNNANTNPFSSFDNISLNDTVVAKLKDTAYWLKENWDWISKVGEVLLITFAGSKFISVLNNIGKLNSSLGTGTGILGSLQSIAAMSAIAIIITVTSNIVQERKELITSIDAMRNAATKYRREWLEDEKSMEEISANIEANHKNAVQAIGEASTPWNQLLGLSDSYLKNAKNVVELNNENVEYLKKQYSQGKLNISDQFKVLDILNQQKKSNDDIIKKLKQRGEDTSELNKLSDKNNKLAIDIYNNLLRQGYGYDEIYKKANITKEEINDIKGICETDITLKFNADMSKAEKNTGNFFTKMGESLGNLFTIKGMSGFISDAWGVATGQLNTWLNGLKGIWKFDEGTNYVPNDHFAIVHKGEAVVPKKFNDRKFFNSNNDETNNLLRELIRTLDEKDMNAYIDPKAIGKTATSYINSQSRIMGRSVIR